MPFLKESKMRFSSKNMSKKSDYEEKEFAIAASTLTERAHRASCRGHNPAVECAAAHCHSCKDRSRQVAKPATGQLN